MQTGRRDLPAWVLQRSAVASAFFGLVAAACNLVALAIYFFGASCAFLLGRGLLLMYRRLPEADQNALVSRRAVRRTAVASLLLAIVISSLYWYVGWWIPADRLAPATRQFLFLHWRKFDFIPAAFAQVLPGSWRSGFHQHFNHVTYCFPGPIWWESMRYLRAAIPGYALALFGCIIGARLLGAKVRLILGR